MSEFIVNEKLNLILMFSNRIAMDWQIKRTIVTIRQMIPIQSLSNQDEPCQKDNSLHQKVALIQKRKQIVYVFSLSLLSDLLLSLRQTRACVVPLRLERGDIGPTCLPSASRAIEFLILKKIFGF